MKRRISACLVIVVLAVLLAVISYLKWDDDDRRGDNIQPNRSTGNDRTNVSQGFRNMTQAEICVSQWQQDILTLEETLRCIDEHMETANS